jgi:tetratricopeptide (TPR) repeat protein
MHIFSRSFAVSTVLLTAALTGCAGDPEARKQELLSSGDSYLKQQQFSAAAIQYRKALQIDPRFGVARLGLARAQEKVGETESALLEYIRAADVLPSDLDLQLQVGTYLLTASQFDDAKVRAEAVLRQDQNNVRAYLILGNALAGLREMDEAVAQIEEALRIDPQQGGTYTSLGMLEARRGRLQEAEKAFERAVELEPASVPSHLARANHYWTTGRIGQAERALRTAFDLEPANAITNRALALLYLGSKRGKQAEPHVTMLASSGAEPFALADYYLIQNRPADAIPILQQLRTRGDKSNEAGRRLAHAYAMHRHFDEADRVIQELLQARPNDAEALLIKGQVLMLRGKREAAHAAFAQAAEFDSRSAPLQFALGQSFAARGDYDRARRAFGEVLRLNPRAATAQVQLARIDLTVGRVASSLHFAREAVRNEPENLDAQVSLIRGLLAAKDVSGARKILDPLLMANPNTAALHTQLALALAAGSDQGGARRSFGRALELDPLSLEALEGSIVLDINAQNFAKARAQAETAMQRSPDSAALKLLAARVFMASRDFAEAERTIRQALQLESDLLAGYTMLGQLYLLQNRLAEARTEFETLAQREPKPVAALTLLGMFALMEGNAAGAQAHFERAIAMEPRAPVPANNLAWLLAERGENLDLALKLAYVAVSGLPNSHEARHTLGWVQYKRRRPDDAIAAFREAIKLAPVDPTYRYHLGLAFLIGERPREARETIERALSLGGATQPWADDAYGVLRTLTSDSEPTR